MLIYLFPPAVQKDRRIIPVKYKLTRMDSIRFSLSTGWLFMVNLSGIVFTEQSNMQMVENK